jgi:hypothetical protein
MIINKHGTKEGFVVECGLIDGYGFKAFETREDAVKYMEDWLGYKLDETILIGETVSNDYGYMRLLYMLYTNCLSCGCVITLSEEEEFDGECENCVAER